MFGGAEMSMWLSCRMVLICDVLVTGTIVLKGTSSVAAAAAAAAAWQWQKLVKFYFLKIINVETGSLLQVLTWDMSTKCRVNSQTANANYIMLSCFHGKPGK